MFYSEYVLAKKGALGKVWLAAHWSKKLTKIQITKSDIVECCNAIVKPTVPLALRTSGHLLLGVVRIYDSKQKSLMTDCQDAMTKIRRAFNPNVVDLAPGESSARIASITLQENFVSFDAEEPEVTNRSFENYLSQPNLNVGRAEDITLKDQYLDFDQEGIRMGDDFGQGLDIPFAQDNQDISIEVNRDGGSTNLSFMDPSFDQTFDLGTNMLPDAVSPIKKRKDFSFNDDIPRETTDEILAAAAQGGSAGEYVIDGTGADFLQPGFMEDYEAPGQQPPREEDEEYVEKIAQGGLEDVEPLIPQTPIARALSSKRKRIVIEDKETEISGKEMRDRLQPDGPNDISRVPYRAQIDVLVQPMMPNTVRGLKRRLQEDEFGLDSPAMPGLSKKVLAAFNRSLKLNSAEEEIDPELEDVITAVVAVEEPVVVSEKKKSRKEKDVSFVEEQQVEEQAIQQGEQVEQQYDQQYDQQYEQQYEQPQDMPNFNEDVTNDPTLDQSFKDITDLAEVEATPKNRTSREEEETSIEVTAEEYAHASWSKRTQKMVGNLRTAFENQDTLSFSEMTQRKTRRTAAACLFELLVLKTRDYIAINQNEPYSDITITPTPRLMVAV